MLTLGSLFDGIGGWQLAAVHAGVKPIWSSEVEKFPLALTKIRFPETEQLGDVTKIDGTKVVPVDIVCAGSPCQNLSVAGNREGLAGEQSGLFRESIRIIRQLRKSTGGGRFFVWENVPGAFTSGSERGADFRAVLESIAETSIPMPKDGRWANAGMVQCPKCEIAWRVFDAQYWGVPQRRKRIFLVADFAATDRRAAKILFVSKGVSGDSEQGRETRKRTASTIEKSIRTASEIVHRGGTAVVKIRSGRDDGSAGKGALIGLEQSFTLGTGNDQTLFQEQKPLGDMSTVGGQTVYENHAQDYRIKQVDVSPTIGTRPTTNPTLVMESIPNETYTIPHDERSACCKPDVSDTLTHYVHYVSQPIPKVYDVNAAKELDRANTLDTSCRGDGSRESHHGPGYSDSGKMYTLNTVEQHGVAYSIGHDERSAQFEPDQADPLTACDYKQPPVVAQPVSTGGGRSYAIGNGQTQQLKMSEIVGTLNCMHDQIAIMQQLVTESKQLEVSAPMTDEDSTDKM